MRSFDFLIGSWDMVYMIPESAFSQAGSGTGTGKFRKALNDKYIFFDYQSVFSSGKAAAHGVFCLEEQEGIHHFWWFEDSGKYQQASCRFVDNSTLYMNWHDTVLSQTFKKIDDETVVLRMYNAFSDERHEMIMEVTFKRQ